MRDKLARKNLAKYVRVAMNAGLDASCTGSSGTVPHVLGAGVAARFVCQQFTMKMGITMGRGRRRARQARIEAAALQSVKPKWHDPLFVSTSLRNCTDCNNERRRRKNCERCEEAGSSRSTWRTSGTRALASLCAADRRSTKSNTSGSPSEACARWGRQQRRWLCSCPGVVLLRPARKVPPRCIPRPSNDDVCTARETQ